MSREEKKLLKMERERASILEALLQFSAILPGTFGEIYRKCGKVNCWCYEGDGHFLTRITWKEEGASKTKAIPKDKIAWVKEVTQNYKSFRNYRRKLQALEVNSKALLDQFEQKLIIKTKRSKNSLDNM
jgi:hypothetical protein